MENQEQQSAGLFELQFDETAKSTIKTMASWAMIMVITTLIGYVLNLVKYFKEKNNAEAMFDSEEFGGSSSMMRTATTTSLVFMIIGILIGLLVTYFLYMFASKSKKGMETMNQYDVNVGFSNFRNYFLIIGIIAIIVIVFVLFAMLAVGSFGGGI